MQLIPTNSDAIFADISRLVRLVDWFYLNDELKEGRENVVECAEVSRDRERDSDNDRRVDERLSAGRPRDVLQLRPRVFDIGSKFGHD